MNPLEIGVITCAKLMEEKLYNIPALKQAHSFCDTQYVIMRLLKDVLCIINVKSLEEELECI